MWCWRRTSTRRWWDRRGRYIGCANPEAGEQMCRVLWDNDEITYLIEIPIFVGDAYIPPALDTSTATPAATDETGISGDAAPPPAATATVPPPPPPDGGGNGDGTNPTPPPPTDSGPPPPPGGTIGNGGD
jgi:hypothetical protein